MTNYQIVRRIETKCLLAKAFLPFVISIGFKFSLDLSGNKTIFFGVVMKDEACMQEKIMASVKAVEDFLRKHINLEPTEFSWDFNYRSETLMVRMAKQFSASDQNVTGFGWEQITQSRQIQTETQPELAGVKG
jgi:hypothetical protein